MSKSFSLLFYQRFYLLIISQVFFVFTIGLTNQLYAQIPAICGDGLEGLGEGSDTTCLNTIDKDRDGFAADVDCDDSSRWIYPGIYRDCGNDGTQFCNDMGQWSSCTEGELCEASGLGDCYFVDPVNGDDNYSGLSRVTAWKTFERIRSYTNNPPPNNHHNLIAGDVVYLMGGDHRTTYEFQPGGIAVAFFQGIAGTSQEPIQFKSYPGEEVRIDPGCEGLDGCYGFYALQAAHVKLKGNSLPIEITNTWDVGIRFAEGSDLEIANVWVHDIDGNAADQGTNQACIRISDMLGDNRVHHVLVHDCYDSQEPSHHNNANIVVFNSDLSRDGNYRIDHSVSFYSQQGTSSGLCIKFKHGNAVGTNEVDHNLLYNCAEGGMSTSDASNYFHHNLVHTSDYCFVARNFGGQIHPTYNIVDHNTCINTRAIHARWDEHYNEREDWQSITASNNIFLDYGTSYSDSIRMNNLNHYYVDDGEIFADYTTIVPSKLDFHDNCYWNQGLELNFSLWGSNPSFGQIIPSFASWQGIGFDNNSYLEDPLLDVLAQATSPNCDGKGWVIDSSGGGGNNFHTVNDYTGDGISDLVVWRPTNGNWYIKDFASGIVSITQWGLNGDTPVYGDFDSDNIYDPAVWRPYSYQVAGVWYSSFYVYPSSGVCPSGWTAFSSGCRFDWGLPGDLPVPADYNGDERIDLAVWRVSSGHWYVAGGSTTQWGLPGDIPVPADYDGDGLIDRAVYRPYGLLGGGLSTFFAIPSNGTCPPAWTASPPGCWRNWGLASDSPIVFDYDSDGLADPAVWRESNSTLYFLRTSNQCPSNTSPHFEGCERLIGNTGGVPVPADYDGDGLVNYGVWHEFYPLEGVWELLDLGNYQFGLAGDEPVQLFSNN